MATIRSPVIRERLSLMPAVRGLMLPRRGLMTSRSRAIPAGSLPSRPATRLTAERGTSLTSVLSRLNCSRRIVLPPPVRWLCAASVLPVGPHHHRLYSGARPSGRSPRARSETIPRVPLEERFGLRVGAGVAVQQAEIGACPIDQQSAQITVAALGD